MIRQMKVKRYWPGIALEWAADADEDGDIRVARAVTSEKAFSTPEESDVVREDDRRLRRLSESSRINNNRDEIRADHRHIRQSEIVSTEEEEKNRRSEGVEEEEADEDAVEERRRSIREKFLQRVQEETALLEEEEEEEEEELSEYETDWEEEDMGILMVKPVYVAKSERDTIAERQLLEAEERAPVEADKRKLEHRKVETRQIVVEKIREDEEIQKNMNMKLEANVGDKDADDEINGGEEYEAWKTREIPRVKRDREESEAMTKEKENKKVRIIITDHEVRKNPKPKQKWKYMQKYHHKSAFFQSEADDPAATAGTDNIFQRDFPAATGEDKMDKTILPKVMQVKHFGGRARARTKWTHLLNEDTTNVYVL